MKAELRRVARLSQVGSQTRVSSVTVDRDCVNAQRWSITERGRIVRAAIMCTAPMVCWFRMPVTVACAHQGGVVRTGHRNSSLLIECCKGGRMTGGVRNPMLLAGQLRHDHRQRDCYRDELA
jgi:hypothetical protein